MESQDTLPFDASAHMDDMEEDSGGAAPPPVSAGTAAAQTPERQGIGIPGTIKYIPDTEASRRTIGTGIVNRYIPIIEMDEGDEPTFGSYGIVSSDDFKLNRGSNLRYFQNYIHIKKEDDDFLDKISESIERGISKYFNKDYIKDILRNQSGQENYDELWDLIIYTDVQHDGDNEETFSSVLFNSLPATESETQLAPTRLDFGEASGSSEIDMGGGGKRHKKRSKKRSKKHTKKRSKKLKKRSKRKSFKRYRRK